MKILLVSDKPALITQVRQASTTDWKLNLSSNLLQKDLIYLVPWELILIKNLAEIPPALDKETLIILDYDRDAREAAIQLKQIQLLQGYRDAPVLLLGTPGCEVPMKAAVAAGASDYLLTPFDIKELQGKMSELLRPVGSLQKLDVEVINPFINATVDVLQTAARINVARKDLFLKKNYRMFGEVSGVMSLGGEAVGSVVISTSARFACALVGKMLNEPAQPAFNEIVRDGIGELVNQVAGAAKATLAESKYHFVLSLPVVVTGTGHEISHKKGSPCIVTVFEGGGGELAIQVSISPKDE
jgi:chemotaxis protein CheX